MSAGEIALIIGAIGTAGGFSALVTIVRDIRKSHREARLAEAERIRQEVRAELYKQQSESTITSKNTEIGELRNDLKEVQERYTQSVDREKRLQEQNDTLITANAQMAAFIGEAS